jgi:hypothetical protein
MTNTNTTLYLLVVLATVLAVVGEAIAIFRLHNPSQNESFWILVILGFSVASFVRLVLVQMRNRRTGAGNSESLKDYSKSLVINTTVLNIALCFALHLVR